MKILLFWHPPLDWNQGEGVRVDNDYVKAAYNNQNIIVNVLDGEFNEEIWIDASKGKAKCRFEGKSCETLDKENDIG